MIKDLYMKEIRQYLYSGKIIFATVVILSLFIINALMCQHNYDKLNALYNQEKLTNEENIRKLCSSFSTLVFINQQSVKPPSHLAFICDASANKLDDAATINVFRLSSLEKLGQGNPYFSSFTAIDWTSIILIVFSFLSISLCYNAFCGERSEGTLKLVLSNYVSRWKVFIAKYIGILSVLTMPLLLGILIHLLVICIGGKIELDLNDYWLILLFLVSSVLFISFNALLFLFISAATSKPVISLSISLITWLLLQVVIPQVFWTSSKMMVKIPTFSQVSTEDQKQSESLWNSPSYYSGWNGEWAGKAPNEYVLKRAALMNALDVSHNQIWGEYTQKLFRQTNFAMNFCKISPYSLYGFLGATISDNGFSGLKNFYAQSENYRESLYKFLTEKDKADPKSYHLVVNESWSFSGFMSNASIMFEEIPYFEYKRFSAVKALTELRWDIFIIIFWSMVLFSAGLIVFVRSDVR
jgi:ABC-type transport system involved in multi-copper enzyme maturation permease subunit